MTLQQEYPWILLFWMPYDNNLWIHEQPVLNMLRRGAQSENVLVVLVSDLKSEDRLIRRLITGDRVVHTEELDVADSSSAQVYSDNLEWLRQRFRARRWALVFLGHGGRLDAICPDEHPAPGLEFTPQWMKIEDLARTLQVFNQSIGGRLDLLFLQNCCKGAFEVTYSFRQAAPYTLASQTQIGAPNYYYERLLQSLGQDPDVSGDKVAEWIVTYEREDMYNSFTLVDNAALGDLPARLNPLIDGILARNIQAHLTKDVTRWIYADELLVDALPLFRSVVDQVGADPGPLSILEEFFGRALILRHDESPMTNYPGLCGLSLFFPVSSDELDRYRYLDIYADTRLADLFDVVSFFPLPVKGRSDGL